MLELIAISSVLGMISGFFAGLFGIGGGLVIVPVLSLVFTAYGLPEDLIMLMAVGTSLATIILTALSAIAAHQRLRAISWPQVWRLAPGIMLGTALGALYAQQLPTATLREICGVFQLLVGVQLALQVKPIVRGLKRSRWIDAVVGWVIGFLSALLGIGGGTLIVPFLFGRQLEMKYAVATSSACGLPIALVGTASFVVLGWQVQHLPEWSVGYVYLPAFAGIVAFSFITAPIGARLAHRLPAGQLKRYFALLLFIMGFKMLAV